MTAKIGDIVVSKRSGRHYKIIRVRRPGAYEAEYVEDPGYPVFFDDDQITEVQTDYAGGSGRPKPTYEELRDAFVRYLAATSLDGGIPFGLTAGDGLLDASDIENWEDEIDVALTIAQDAGGLLPMTGWVTKS